jgi:hypothetical protein
MKIQNKSNLQINDVVDFSKLFRFADQLTS